MFHRIPTEVVRSIIFEWLNVSSICRLDSACCAEGFRTEFLEHLSAEHSILLDWQEVRGFQHHRNWQEKNANLTRFYNWASSRQLKVSSIEIDGDTEPKILEKYLNLTDFCVKSVRFSELHSEIMEMSTALISNSLSNLQEVAFNKCGLTQNFRGLMMVCAGTLRKLSIQYCDNVVPDYFAGIKCSLLTMVTTSLDTESTTALLSMSDRITYLSCAQTYYDSYTFLSLPCCASLQILDLSWASVGDADILTVCGNCTQLNAINLRGCKRLTDVAIVALVTRCSHLRTLRMGYNDNYTDTSLQAIAEHAPHLQSLNVSVCHQLTTAGLVGVLTACQSLHTLLLDNRAGDSSHMLQIAQHLPGTITHLLIIAFDVNVAVLMAVAQRCPLLVHLDMRYSTAVAQTQAQQQQGVAAVASGCPRLRTVVMAENEQSALRAVWQALRPDVSVLTTKEQPLPCLLLLRKLTT